MIGSSEESRERIFGIASGSSIQSHRFAGSSMRIATMGTVLSHNTYFCGPVYELAGRAMRMHDFEVKEKRVNGLASRYGEAFLQKPPWEY